MADLLEHLAEVRRMLKAQGFRAAGDTITDAILEIELLRGQNVGRNVGGDGLGDGRRICEALGFDPTNHHNALKCPYCNPDGLILAKQPAQNCGTECGAASVGADNLETPQAFT